MAQDFPVEVAGGIRLAQVCQAPLMKLHVLAGTASRCPPGAALKEEPRHLELPVERGRPERPSSPPLLPSPICLPSSACSLHTGLLSSCLLPAGHWFTPAENLSVSSPIDSDRFVMAPLPAVGGRVAAASTSFP